MGIYLPWKRRASKLEVVNGECSKTIMDIGGRNSKILMGNVIAFLYFDDIFGVRNQSKSLIFSR